MMFIFVIVFSKRFYFIKNRVMSRFPGFLAYRFRYNKLYDISIKKCCENNIATVYTVYNKLVGQHVDHTQHKKTPNITLFDLSIHIIAENSFFIQLYHSNILLNVPQEHTNSGPTLDEI